MALRIAVVLNLKAGSPKEESLRARLEGILGGGPHSLAIHSASTGPGLQKAAAGFLAAGCNVLVAGGGDGTVSSLASLLVNSNTALGVLPLGTLNHFARDLGIPPDLEGAARLLLTGKSTTVDIGALNNRYFINNSSLGLYPGIVRRREIWERTGWSRVLAFAAAIFYAFRRYPFLNVRLRVDGREFARRSPFVFVGNNQYDVEGIRLGRRSGLDSGVLALYTANRTGRLGLLRIAISALLKRLKLNRDFEVLEAHELLIETRRRRVAVALDGEVVHMSPPLRYSIHPGALRVLVPA